MKLEDFYQAIRTKEEPKDFNEIKEFIDPGTFQTKEEALFPTELITISIIFQSMVIKA